MVLAYAIMSNHFHIFIYVPEPEEIYDEKARRGYAFMYGNAGSPWSWSAAIRRSSSGSWRSCPTDR